MWFLLATTNGHVRDEFWERSQKDRRFDGAPFLMDDLMSKTRFNYILGRLKLFSLPYPSFKDLFHPVRELIAEWNKNMALVFIAGWLCCLDESMSKWISMFTCTGFVFCPRKPWPYGNKWHTIACVVPGIVFLSSWWSGRISQKNWENNHTTNCCMMDPYRRLSVYSYT